MEKKNDIDTVHPEEIADVIKALVSEGNFAQIRANLWRIAQTRHLVGATLNLNFAEVEGDYYNVYRYAFFGKVPEPDIEVVKSSELNLIPEKFEIRKITKS